MASVVENLKAAKALISDPSRWTQNVYARDVYGNDLLSGKHPAAVCFCSKGALQKVMYSEDDFAASEFLFLREAARELGNCGPASYNDRRSHEVVMWMWDLAIKKAEEAEHVQGS